MSDLFIIGAGASAAYDFPTGDELYGIIRKLDFSSEEKIKAAYKEYYDKDFSDYGDGKHIFNFMKSLASELDNSMMVSIDDFIRNRNYWTPELNIEAGLIKRIIAKIIFEYEKNAKEKRITDWLHYFCSRVDRVYDKDREHIKNFFLKSKFITFNYDRLLEYSIYKYFDYDKGIDKNEITAILKDMNIIHVNGYLGPLYYSPFGYKENINDANVREIKTTWDKDTDDKTEKINERISYSNRIFFLGFGYLEENMKKLGLTINTETTNAKILAGKKIYGTAFGKKEAEIKRIIDILKSCGAEEKDIEINEKRDAKDLIIDFFNIEVQQ